jgi:hypothetical protein
MMTVKPFAIAAAGLVLVSGAAQARELYDDLFFVRTGASAASLFQDRADCRNTAVHMGGTAATYSNPQYGAISAMGSALDEDALHDGGLRLRLQQAVFVDCMKQKGWVQAAPTAEEVKLLMRASLRHPEPLNDWLKSHEPPPAAPPAPVVKTAASSAGAAN